MGELPLGALEAGIDEVQDSRPDGGDEEDKGPIMQPQLIERPMSRADVSQHRRQSGPEGELDPAGPSDRVQLVDDGRAYPEHRQVVHHLRIVLHGQVECEARHSHEEQCQVGECRCREQAFAAVEGLERVVYWSFPPTSRASVQISIISIGANCNPVF